jgi:hypothetical protein
METERYIEITSKTNNLRKIINSKDLVKYVKVGEELYRSYFEFDKEIKEHIASGRKTPSGYIGIFYCSSIVLDVDKGSDSFEGVLNRTKNLVNRLIKEYDLEDNFQIWYSGTGFHIVIPDIFGIESNSKLPMT